MEDRPRAATFLSSLADYSNTIPTASTADPDAAKPAPPARMGTLIGVYLPCIQNIFGVILFIRLTWVVGTAGAIQGFLIVLTCCCTVSESSATTLPDFNYKKEFLDRIISIFSLVTRMARGDELINIAIIL